MSAAADVVSGARALAGRLREARARGVAGRRLLVALAGPPGAGKSTLAAALLEHLPDAIVVPMDGFHLDDALLGPAGLLPIKGSPATFDVGGLAATLARLRRDDGVVHVPVFDRERELSRAAAASVEPCHRTVIVEGNYVLLERAPWAALGGAFDLGVMIDVEETVLRERLVGRWRKLGFGASEALARAASNDLPNGALVRSASRAPDIVFSPDLSAASG